MKEGRKNVPVEGDGTVHRCDEMKNSLKSLKKVEVTTLSAEEIAKYEQGINQANDKKKVDSMSDEKYLHGFSKDEQERLRRQSRFGNLISFLMWIFFIVKMSSKLAGVGAQTEILLRRFPESKIEGIDFSEKQIQAAKENLKDFALFKDRYHLQQMDATNLSFDSDHFDGAYLCWVLEHIKEPMRVLSEVRRTLRPGGQLYVTEVMNSSFFLEPYSPNVWKYWMAFNDFQYDHAGDPFIGAKLGNFLTAVGFRDVQTKVITAHLDNRHPGKRRDFIAFWTDLLLSAQDHCLKISMSLREIVDGCRKELDLVSKDPNAVFLYSFMHARPKYLKISSHHCFSFRLSCLYNSIITMLSYKI